MAEHSGQRPEFNFHPEPPGPLTDYDVVMAFGVFLGRDPESSSVIDYHRSQSFPNIMAGCLASSEFHEGTILPMQSRQPPQRNDCRSRPSDEQIDWLSGHVMFTEAERDSLAAAPDWGGFFHALHLIGGVDLLKDVPPAPEMAPAIGTPAGSSTAPEAAVRQAGAAGAAARRFPLFSLDSVAASPCGAYLIVGWIDDADAKLAEIRLAAQGATLAATTSLARCRRPDAETTLGTQSGHMLGFWTLMFRPDDVPPPASCTLTLFAGAAWQTVTVQPKTVGDAQLRDMVFEYLHEARYFGNPQNESFVQLTAGPGAELLRFNDRISSSITSHAYVQRFGPARASFDGSVIVCLYGKPEFLFLQAALFSAGRGSERYEYIYVSNSPELAEALLKEARIAEQIYGLSLTLVILPGNAGFGAANNVAARHARSKRILIVNPDVFPRRTDWAEAHTRLVATLPPAQTALFGVPLYYDDGSLMHGGMYFDIDTGLSVRPNGIDRQIMLRVEHYGKGAPPDTPAYLRARPVPAVTGAFISADHAWFDELGGFSQDYVFGHYEDADLCLRSLERGRPAWLHNIPFWHLEGKGSDRRPAHDGGSLINRWHFTQTWGERIAEDMCGRAPACFDGPAFVDLQEARP
jgi:GT2 family glycosyltransferase